MNPELYIEAQKAAAMSAAMVSFIIQGDEIQSARKLARMIVDENFKEAERIAVLISE